MMKTETAFERLQKFAEREFGIKVRKSDNPTLTFESLFGFKIKEPEESMSNTKDSLGDRMKENYENRAKTYLTRRTPVIIRLDGKAFHTFTKGFRRPYDEVFHKAMNHTMWCLCNEIQGCKLGYTQSDEITLLLTDYDTLTTDAWFGYSVQKLCSISASIATRAFSKSLQMITESYRNDYVEMWERTEEDTQYLRFLERVVDRNAYFDSRCFNIPKEEVTNCFIWRQQDATRNAIQMLGQCYFSHKELDKKNTGEICEMLRIQKEIEFEDMPTEFKRGVCCVKHDDDGWHLDTEIPVFTQDRNYVERWVYPTEETEPEGE